MTSFCSSLAMMRFIWNRSQRARVRMSADRFHIPIPMHATNVELNYAACGYLQTSGSKMHNHIIVFSAANNIFNILALTEFQMGGIN